MIIELPPSILVNSIVPKDRFKFTDATKINRIRWVAKLAANTLNISTPHLLKLEIFAVDMPEFDQTVLIQILNLPVSTQTLTEQINQYEQAKVLRAQIQSLNNSIKREKQLNKKQALARQRYALEQQLSELGE